MSQKTDNKRPRNQSDQFGFINRDVKDFLNRVSSVKDVTIYETIRFGHTSLSRQIRVSLSGFKKFKSESDLCPMMMIDATYATRDDWEHDFMLMCPHVVVKKPMTEAYEQSLTKLGFSAEKIQKVQQTDDD